MRLDTEEKPELYPDFKYSEMLSRIRPRQVMQYAPSLWH